MHKPPGRMLESDQGQRFSEEHRELMREVAALQSAAGAEDRRASYGRIRAMLPGHFADEERRDGLFEWLLALVPDRADEVAQLIEDHRAMAALIDELDASADGAALFLELAEQIREHEARETRLVRDALA